jgi:hypothetical protein
MQFYEWKSILARDNFRVAGKSTVNFSKNRGGYFFARLMKRDLAGFSILVQI